MRKILLVEDSDADAAFITDAVQDQVQETVEVVRVRSVKDGQAAVLSDAYDCVLLDLNLPDSVGVDTVAVFRGLRPLLPVVVVSGDTSPGVIRSSLQLGAEDYVTKDSVLIRPGPLGHSIVAAMERRRTRGAPARLGNEGSPAVVRIVAVSADPAIDTVLPSRMIDLDHGDLPTVTETERVSDIAGLRKRLRQGSPPDCVVLDLAATGRTGIQSVALIHKMLPLTTLVVLTDDDRDQFSLTALEMGADDVLPRARVDGVLLRRSLRHSYHRRQKSLRLSVEAQRDVLTGLPGRAMLLELLADAMRRLASGDATSVTVVFLDLDGFKTVNDQMGHAVGDTVLRIIAGRLCTMIRTDDVAARLGGDEFVIIAENRTVLEAEAMGARLDDLLSEPITLDDQYAAILRASHGIVWTSTPRSPEEVLAEADRRMYTEKRARQRAGDAVGR